MSYTPPQSTAVDFELEDAPAVGLDEVSFEILEPPDPPSNLSVEVQ